MKLLFRLDQMRKRIHNDVSLYLISPVPGSLVYHPQLLGPLDVDIYRFIRDEIIEIFRYVELVFDIVSDPTLYDLNSFSEGRDGDIQRLYNTPKPEYFNLLVSFYVLRQQLTSELELLYGYEPQFIVKRPCPTLSTTEKKTLLYTLSGQIVFLLRQILCREASLWNEECALRETVHVI